MDRAVGIALLAFAVVGAALIVATTGGLPDTVATHFAGDGRPNGWMSREAYAWLMGALALGLPLVTFASLTILPRRWPHLVNLPFRDYWLAPERREATLRRLATLGAVVAAFGVAVIGVVHVEVLLANARVPPRTDGSMVWLTIGIALAIVVFVVVVASRFRVPRDARR